MIHPTMAWRRRGSDDIVVANIIRSAECESEINVDTIHTMGYSIVRLHNDPARQVWHEQKMQSK
jgi:hypothetical protein